jgi:tRNA-dihydrouridine synthase B
MRIGPIELPVTGAHPLFVAPMAGVTDRPFRVLCKRLGAHYAVSEMVTSRRDLWHSLKTSRRADHTGEPAPIAVQIAGVDPQEMADAARYNVDRGAQVIDINMGCPAKKVCKVWAGSALMSRPTLAVRIVEAVVEACAPHGVPVTLKMRTGACQAERNAVALARAAESAGVAMVTVHGRTREQGYSGHAEYDTIAAVKAALRVPVVANGDIDTPHKAREVLARTGADAWPPARTWLRHSRTRCAGGCSSTCTITMNCTARTPACAARASTSAGRCARCPAARPSARR